MIDKATQPPGARNPKASEKDRTPSLLLPYDDWPEIDRLIWAEALIPAGR